jgi:hypothetical protein
VKENLRATVQSIQTRKGNRFSQKELTEEFGVGATRINPSSMAEVCNLSEDTTVD